MIAALLLAACQPLATCGSPVIPPCGTPTPTLKWDRVADAPNAIVAGYKVYARTAAVSSWTLAATLPCWTDDDGSKRCLGVDLDYPVQRVTNVQLDTVEWCVRAYDLQGDEGTPCSNIQSICMPAICTRPGPCS